MDRYEPSYHIYLNDTCIKANLNPAEFEKEMSRIKGFLELTNLENIANIDYVRCEPPSRLMLEGSY